MLASPLSALLRWGFEGAVKELNRNEGDDSERQGHLLDSDRLRTVLHGEPSRLQVSSLRCAFNGTEPVLAGGANPRSIRLEELVARLAAIQLTEPAIN